MALGLVIFAFALLRQARPLGLVLIIGSLVPVVDGFIAVGEQWMVAGWRH
ncbi:MAG: DUF4267 domain-containing protein [Hyphomicrobiales bacterium]|nr:DUF4267 domain-containing protein [Hyphomicrobiales bacterium]